VENDSAVPDPAIGYGAKLLRLAWQSIRHIAVQPDFAD
jgi:hypothetical protein